MMIIAVANQKGGGKQPTTHPIELYTIMEVSKNEKKVGVTSRQD